MNTPGEIRQGFENDGLEANVGIDALESQFSEDGARVQVRYRLIHKKGERFSEICTSPSAWLAQLYGLVRRCVFMISYKLEDLVELGFTTQYTAQSCILCKRVPAIKS